MTTFFFQVRSLQKTDFRSTKMKNSDPFSPNVTRQQFGTTGEIIEEKVGLLLLLDFLNGTYDLHKS